MKKLYSLFLFFFPFFVQAQSTYFVNQSAANFGTGTSWVSAYNNLHAALKQAVYGDQIWVAQGVYKPTDDNNRDSTFLLKNGIRLFGGFIGNETTINQRKIIQNTTIIDGNISNLNDSLDNSYTLLFLENCDTATIVDGFTFQNGNANSTSITDNYYGRQKCGGAIYIEAGDEKKGNPIIRNCFFANNNAQYCGGAIYYNSRNDGVNTLRLYNCTFFNNKAQSQGGAVFIENLRRYATIENTVQYSNFKNNYANGEGGAIYATSYYNNFDLKINKCYFNANSSDASGSSIELSSFTKSVYLQIDSCLFEKEYSINGNCISLTDALGTGLTGVIRYCDFKNNNFLKAYMINFYGGKKLQIQYCNFMENNTADLLSGSSNLNGIYNNIDMRHCLFLSNKTKNGRLIYLSRSKLVATNCIFANHKNTLFYLTRSKSDTSSLDVTNCLFFNHQSILNLDGINFSFPAYGIHRFNNCIFQANNLNNNRSFTGNGPIEINNSIFDAVNKDSLLFTTLGNTPILSCNNSIFNRLTFPQDTTLLDFHLTACSPAINAGNNVFLSANENTDFEGKARIQYEKVDIGPYEYQDFKQLTDTTSSAWCGLSNGKFGLGCANACLPLTYQWTNQNGQKGTGNTNLKSGTYTVIVRDKQDCKDTVTLNIGTIQVLNANVIITNASNPNASNGAIEILSVINGVPPYTVSWSNGALGAKINNLSSGTYSFTLTDANGCTFSESNTVSYSIATQEQEKIILHSQTLPNPFKNETLIRFTLAQAGTARITVSDVTGRVVSSYKSAFKAGSNDYLFQYNSDYTGLLFYKIESNEATLTGKMLKIN